MVNALVQFGAQNGIKTVLADVAENAGSCGVMRTRVSRPLKMNLPPKRLRPNTKI